MAAKLLAAIDTIVQDSDKKFDECLIEQFLEYISSEVKKGNHDNRNEYAQSLLRKLQAFVDDDAFVMVNQARVYKIYSAVFRSMEFDEDSGSLETVRSHLESFWSSLGSAVINRNLAAITAALVAIQSLLSSTPTYKWIIASEFRPPIKILTQKRKFEIEDVITLAEFYMETSENYHTKNKAEHLFRCLIETAIKANLEGSHQHFQRLQITIQSLVGTGSASILHLLVDILSGSSSSLAPDEKRIFLERFDIGASVDERFMASLNGSRDNLNTICRLLGLISEKENFSLVLDKLRHTGNVEPIISFLMNSSTSDLDRSIPLLKAYLLGPLVLRCRPDSSDIDLGASGADLEFIEKHNSDKLVTNCLTQIGQIIDGTKFSAPIIALTIRALLIYIRTHSASLREYKNVMLCCNNMTRLFKSATEMSNKDTLESIVSTVMDSLPKLQSYDECFKPIVLELLGLLCLARKELVLSKEEEDQLWSRASAQVAILAANYSDQEMLDEFSQEWLRSATSESVHPAAESTSETGEEDTQLGEMVVKPESLIDEILNYELLSDGIIDCY